MLFYKQLKHLNNLKQKCMDGFDFLKVQYIKQDVCLQTEDGTHTLFQFPNSLPLLKIRGDEEACRATVV